MNNRGILYLLFWFLAALSAGAQQYPTRMYTLRDGLPQMQVTTTLADSRGYVWLSTKNGLAKFDGEQFETYSSRDYALKGKTIWSLAEDSKHIIWFKTSFGIVSFDGATFHRFPHPAGIAPNSGQVYVDSQDRSWFICHPDSDKPNQLYCFDKGRYRTVNEVVPGSDSLLVHGVATDRQQKKVWILAATRRQPSVERIYVLTNNRWQAVPNYSQPVDNLPFNFVPTEHALLLQKKDSRGRVTILRVQDEAAIIPLLAIDGPRATVLQHAPFSICLMPIGSGNSSVLYRYTPGSNHVETMLSLPGNYATAPTIRLNNRLYVGTEKGLLEVYDNGLRYFTEEQAPYVWSVAESPKGEMWWLNYGGSPPRKFSNGTVQPLNEPGLQQLMRQPVERPIDNNYYYHPATDRQGKLYLPNANALIQFDGRNWKRLTNQIALYVYADERTDRVFVGEGGGFSHFERGKLIRRIDEKSGLFLCPYGLCAVADAEPDIYWLGGPGMARYNARTGKITNFTKDAGTLPTNGVLDLCRDKWNAVWVASADGLYRYNPQNRRLSAVGAELMKRISFVGLLTDSTLAIGDTYGVYLLDLAQYYRTGKVSMQVLNHRTGYMGIEPGQAGFYKDRQGRAWITSSTVLSYIDTKTFTHQPMPLRPLIRTLNGKRLPFTCTDSVFSVSGQPQTIRLDFEVMGNNRPFTTQYAWQLNDGPWSDWQTEPYTTLRDFNGGRHTVRLKARSGGLNEVRDQITTLHFSCHVPFFTSPRFRQTIPYGIAALLLVGAFLLFTLWHSRREAEQARQQLAEREREALYLNVQTIQSQLNTHFMFNALGPLQNQIQKNEPKAANAMLVEFSALVRGMLETASTGNAIPGTLSLRNQQITLAEEIALLKRYVNFEHRLYQDKITVHFDENSIDGKLDPDSIELPPMLIQPFVENAIKHGLVHKEGPGNLWIRFTGLDETLICTVEDDGIGREGMRQLTEHSPRMYRSLGSQLVLQRAGVLNQLGYAITIQTNDRTGGGTVVTITIAQPD